MNRLLRPRIWPSSRASSAVEPCDVPFRYASGPIPRYRGMVARWHTHLHGLATAIHETSGLGVQRHKVDFPASYVGVHLKYLNLNSGYFRARTTFCASSFRAIVWIKGCNIKSD
jgi:hypothetical protein